MTAKNQSNGQHPGSRSASPGSLMMALEPRILMDAAGLVTALAVLDDEQLDTPGNNEAPANDGDNTVDPLIQTAADLVEEQRNELVVLDVGADRGIVLQGLNAEGPYDPNTQIQVLRLDAGVDPLQQIGAALDAALDGFDAIRIFGETRGGTLALGNLDIAAADLDNIAGRLHTLHENLDTATAIKVYGYENLAGQTDVGFIRDLSASAADNGEDATDSAAAGEAPRREILFVDSALQDYDTLIEAYKAQQDTNTEYRIIVIGSGENGLQTVTDTLAAYGEPGAAKLDALHILSHADQADLTLGNVSVDLTTLDLSAVSVQLTETWAGALNPGADILLYGCNVAAGQAGVVFVEQLGELTQADIAASDDPTGNAELGGDWELEYRNGLIETGVLSFSEYRHLLGTTAISGKVIKDVEGDGDISGLQDVGIPGVHVYLYRDINGNDLPDNSDVHYATAITDSAGNYAFPDSVLTYTLGTLPNDTYWLVAESDDIDTLGATIEQTYGGAGAMYDPQSDGDTTVSYRPTEGAAFGGRRMDTYDNFSSTNLDLDAAEHIIRIEVDGTTNPGNDFGFGFISSLMAGYSEFYVPGDADLVWEMFESVDNTPDLVEADGLRMITSVTTSTDNIRIFYDHWEDGYDFDPQDPYNTADEVRTVSAGGTPEIFESANIPVKARGTGEYYDFGDRLYVVGGPVSVTTNMWPESIGTVFANSWELYPIKPLQTVYNIPGTAYDTVAGFDDFSHVYAFIQATEDGTTISGLRPSGPVTFVTYDPATGEPQEANPGGVPLTLNRGESVLLGQVVEDVKDSGGNIISTNLIGTPNNEQGVTVTGSKPLQVNYMMGDGPHGGSRSESRGITAAPDALWDDQYFMPIANRDNIASDVYLFNINPYPIVVNAEYSTAPGGATTVPITVPAYSLVSYQDETGGGLPASALQLTSEGGAKFSAFASIDTEAYDYDWGMNLVPAYILRDEYYLGWAPGGSDYPESQPPYTPTANYSPAWITPKYDNTTVFVDIDNDGVADGEFTVNRFDSLDVRASDFGFGNDNSGMHIWATGPIAVAWGQDSNSGVTGSPGMDLGYGGLPLPMEWMDVAMGVVKTTDNPTVNFGSTVDFTLAVPAWQAVSDLNIQDTLPPGWSYVNESSVITFDDADTKTTWVYSDADATTIDAGSAVEPSQGSSLGRTTLNWNIQKAPFDIQDLDPNDYVVIRFTAQTPATGTAGVVENESTVCGERDLDGDE